MRRMKSEDRVMCLRLDPESEEVIRQIRVEALRKGEKLLSETEVINRIIREHPAYKAMATQLVAEKVDPREVE